MTLTTTHKNRDLAASSMILATNESTEVITGHGLLQTTEDLVPMAMMRRKGRFATYIWAISLDAAPVNLVQLQKMDLRPEIAITVKVTRNDKTWTLTTDSEKKSFTAN